MKKILAIVAIVSFMAMPVHAGSGCGCKKKGEAMKNPNASKGRGTQVSAANQKAHEAAKTEKEAIKAEASAGK